MKLATRIQKLEAEVQGSGLPAVLYAEYSAFFEAEDLVEGPNEKGIAVISAFWWVWFLSGTREEQERELANLRNHPRFKLPPHEKPNWFPGELRYIEYINGASFDMTAIKLYEEDLKKRTIRLLDEPE